MNNKSINVIARLEGEILAHDETARACHELLGVDNVSDPFVSKRAVLSDSLALIESQAAEIERLCEVLTIMVKWWEIFR
jgi:hypothetical protein